jgi:uncharacterized membrane protein YcaP (DUF421 family)
MQIGSTVIHCAIAYGYLLICVRLSCKRLIRQGTAMDLTVGLMLGELADSFLAQKVTAGPYLVATTLLFLLHSGTKIVSSKFPKIARLLTGTATPLVKDGAQAKSGCRRERLSTDELHAELREQSVTDVRSVAAADLEVDGTVTVLKEEWAKAAQKADIGKVRAVPRQLKN